MSETPKSAGYWRAKAEETRKLAIGMRDPISRQRMFEMPASYDERTEQERKNATRAGGPRGIAGALTNL